MSTMILDQLFDSPRSASSEPTLSARRAARRSSVRLTRRGRIVVFAAGLLVLLALGLLISNGAGAASKTGTPEPTHAVVVAPGDTLWDLASKAAHGGDVRAMITHIEEINGLSDVSLSAGQTLRIPD